MPNTRNVLVILKPMPTFVLNFTYAFYLEGWETHLAHDLVKKIK